HDMVKSFVLEIGTDRLRGSGCLQHHRCGGAEGTLEVIVQWDGLAILNEIVGKAYLLSNYHAIAFEQAEPGGLRAHEPFELLECGGHDGSMVLGPSNARRERVH